MKDETLGKEAFVVVPDSKLQEFYEASKSDKKAFAPTGPKYAGWQDI